MGDGGKSKKLKAAKKTKQAALMSAVGRSGGSRSSGSVPVMDGVDPNDARVRPLCARPKP
jgi:hypothetical protein